MKNRLLLLAVLVAVATTAAPAAVSFLLLAPVQSQEAPKAKPCTPAVQKLIDEAGEAKTSQEVLETLAKAAEVARKAKDVQGEGLAQFWTGKYLWATAYDRACLRSLDSSFELFQASGDIIMQAVALNESGLVLYSLRELKAAKSKYDRALPLYRKCGAIQGEAAALVNIGSILDDLGDKKEAMANYEQALPLLSKVEDLAGVATVLNNIGFVLETRGDSLGAMAKYEQALALYIQRGDAGGQATTMNNIGALFGKLGDAKAAIAKYDEALPLYRKSGDVGGEAIALNNTGLMLWSLGDYKTAMAKYEEALPLRRKCGDIKGEAATLDNIGGVLSKLGDKKGAIQKHEAALALCRKCGDLTGEAWVLNNIGAIFLDQENNAGALARFEDALPICRKVADAQGEAMTLNNIGVALTGLGDEERAMASFETALLLRRKCKDTRGEAGTLANMADAFGKKHQSLLATAIEKLAVNLLQELREKAPVTLAETYTKTVSRDYDKLDSALLAQGRLSEKWQVQAMLEGDRGDPDGTRRKGAFSARIFLTREEESWRQKYEASGAKLATDARRHEELQKNQLRTPEEDKEIAALETRLEEERVGHIALVREMAEAFKTTEPNQRDIDSIRQNDNLRQDLRRFEKDTGKKAAAVRFLVTHDKLYAFVFLPGATHDVVTEVTRANLSKLVDAYWAACRDPYADWKPAGKALWDGLGLAKVAEALQGADHVMVRADGALRYVPFGALWDPAKEEFLAQRFTTSRFDERSMSRLHDAPAGKRTAQAFGNSRNLLGAEDIPNAGEEAADIGKMFGTKALVGSAFTKDAFLKALASGEHAGLHVSSHFLLEPGSDAGSFLLLGDIAETLKAKKEAAASQFTIGDMARLDQVGNGGVDVMFLSACSTAVPTGDGSDLEGLAAWTETKGPKAVVATSWSVDDAATRAVVERFWERWKEGKSKADALALAKRGLLSGEVQGKSGTAKTTDRIGSAGKRTFTPDPKKPWAHPYYWAGFELFGNWR